MTYAANTSTPVSKSRAELEHILRRAGAMRQMWGSGPEGDLLAFELHGRQYRFTVRQPTKEDAVRVAKRQGVALDLVKKWPERVDQEWRRRWRTAVLWLKATIEFAEDDPALLERLFLGSLVLPDGLTFGQWASPQIEAMYDRGAMPPLLGMGDE
jgi:hypothetical protein